jgi:hypothetical protein
LARRVLFLEGRLRKDFLLGLLPDPYEERCALLEKLVLL